MSERHLRFPRLNLFWRWCVRREGGMNCRCYWRWLKRDLREKGDE